MHHRPVALALSLVLLLAGCAGAPDGHSESEDHAEPGAAALSHVHAIVTDPVTERLLLGTHEGLFAIAADGAVAGPLGGHDFDAMGLAAAGGALIASGHPGPTTPGEWGAPHLGILRSADGGSSWVPVAYTGVKDFHALASGPSGELYGLATDDAALLRSADGGLTWNPTGADLAAAALVVDAQGAVLATTADGVQLSVDGGATFAAVPGAPLLRLLGASPDRGGLVGVDTDGGIWRASAADAAWTRVGDADGSVQAVALTASGTVALVDGAGFRVLDASP